MKVRFSKNKLYVPSYNGNQNAKPEDQLTANLRVLSQADLINVMDALQESGVSGEVDAEKANLSQMRPILELSTELLPVYVVGLKNLQDEDGNELTIKDVVEAAFFLPLQIELLLQLSVISTPTEDAVKN